MLLLNRTSPPNMGLWTGTGGKIEQGETPEQGILREVEEEAGLQLAAVDFMGVVTWQTETETDGMYMFVATPSDATPTQMPGAEAEDAGWSGYGPPRSAGQPQSEVISTREGILAWKPLPWILDPRNVGIAPHLRRFLRTAVLEDVCAEHRCRFASDVLVDYDVLPISEEYVRQVTLFHRMVDAAP